MNNRAQKIQFLNEVKNGKRKVEAEVSLDFSRLSADERRELDSMLDRLEREHGLRRLSDWPAFPKLPLTQAENISLARICKKLLA